MSNRGGVRLRPELCGSVMSKCARSGAGLAVASGSWFSGVLSTKGSAGELRDGLVAASGSWFSGALSTRGPIAVGLGDGLVAASASWFSGGTGLTMRLSGAASVVISKLNIGFGTSKL